mmetsp:Transcript_30143/g.55532  ORF Transcript_30143/g.55532 Transcript_30143/m.55532 type:complete len:869 (+) Transcript_30143:99-2705(+)
MGYPKADPRAKHDIICSPSIIDAVSSNNGSTNALRTIEELTSSIIQSAIPLPELPRDIKKVSTVYTYPDAPTKPKPLSRAPRIWKLATRSLFDAATNNIASKNSNNNNGTAANGDGDIVKQCIIAVKLPSKIHPQDAKSHKNSKSFHEFMKFLQKQKLVAVLACDSAGRIGFVVPENDSSSGSNGNDGWDDNNNNNNNDSGGESHYAANLYYAPMKEFLPRAKKNHATAAATANLQSAEDEPETWTPQYPPPPEEECVPRGWEGEQEGGKEPETWTPQYDPPPEEECGPRGWENHDHNNNNNNHVSDEPVFKMEDDDDDDGPLFVPPADDNDADGLFVPPGATDEGLGNGEDTGFGGDDGLFVPPGASDGGGGGGWDTSDAWGNNNDDAFNNDNSNTDANVNNDTGLGGWDPVVEPSSAAPFDAAAMKDEGVFHANTGAAAADAFYSGLTRTLDTRADSILYHMRSFNGWVKATQIAELDPDTSRASSKGQGGGKKRSRTSPMRVLDLACGKGGDLGKWSLHTRKLENYVGVDVARGSLVDAAIRARVMGKRNNASMRRCTFTLADLGEDVPGRKRSKNARRMQKLLTWNLQNETHEAKEGDPVFVAEEGGGISESDKFDVVSIQFAIHYMMSTRKRARRFFHTVSSLLEVGGNLIATTIDARVVVEKLMGLGKDFHFDDYDLHEEVDRAENDERHHNGNRKRKVSDDNDGEPAATVAVGRGVCRLKFDKEILHKVFCPPKTSEDMFGLQYTFTLVEGSDHAAGVGEAVDLPEWLTPIPALEELAEESGLQLEYATNFHKFYQERKNPAKFPMAHNALYNMKVLNRDGSISDQEWEVSRMYIALKFRKVKESKIDLGEEDVGAEEMRE